MGSAGQGSPGLAHVVQSEGTGAGCARWLLHTCLAPLGRSGFLTGGGFGLVPLLTRGLASPERVFQETQAEVKGFLRPSFRSHMASFLTPNSIGQSESQAPCRFLGRGEGLHLALGGTAIFLQHTSALEDRAVLLSTQQTWSGLLQWARHSSRVEETKLSTALSLMELAFWWAQKTKKEPNTQGNLRLPWCKREKQDPE